MELEDINGKKANLRMVNEWDFKIVTNKDGSTLPVPIIIDGILDGIKIRW